ncbi:MAG: carboxypeptidase-like regulatory domain-containing protein [Planctomycetota bacterium]
MTFEGVVLDPSGLPAAGAIVVSDVGGMATSGEDGSFRLALDLPEETRELRITAVHTDGNGRHTVGNTSVTAARTVIPQRIGALNLTGGTCQPSWLPAFGGLPGVAGEVHAQAIFDDGSGPALYVGGEFRSVSGIKMNNVGRWNGTSWSSLGTGVNLRVFALSVFNDGGGDKLYAASPLGVASWNGTTWSSLPGLVGTARCLETFNGQLYVGGDLSAHGVPGGDNVARWTGTSWAALATGLDDQVQDLAVFDDGLGQGPALYAVGDFTGRVARWNGTTWSFLGTGVVGQVHAVVAAQVGGVTSLYVGGSFTSIGGISASGVARWNGTSWSPLGSGITGTEVNTLLAGMQGTQPVLFAGGDFTEAGGSTAGDLAVWNGSVWAPLGSGSNGVVRALAQEAGGAVVAGGLFSEMSGRGASSLARWDGASWSGFGAGFNGSILALLMHDDGSGPAMFACGEFTSVAGISARRIAKYDGTSWSPLGSGLNNWANCMTVFDDGLGGGPALYVGGNFTDAGGVSANRIAKWDGASWSPLGTGMGVHLHQLEVFDPGTGPELYACGDFTSAGGVPANFIAKWNGANWSALGSGLGFIALSLEVYDAGAGPRLYVGGIFNAAGGLPADHFARWNGSSWSTPAVGGLNDQVYDLLSADIGEGPKLYAVGMFTQAGGSPAKRIASWNGSSWSSLGAGLNDWAFTLGMFDDGSGPALFASGQFTATGSGDTPLGNVGKWDGTSWSALGQGLVGASDVGGMVAFDDGSGSGPSFYISGDFEYSVETADSYLARWRPGGDSPTITAPDFVHVRDPGSPGEVVFFTVTATGSCEPVVSLLCTPPSGSTFPPGQTVVTCTAIDAGGDQTVRKFPVIVGKARQR